jgi:amidase
MRLPEYDRLDALALADLVRRREVTPAELLDAALERTDARNPRLNAIIARYDDEARARARGPLPDGPFSGVPFLLKDLLAAWKGHPHTGSSRLLAGWTPAADSEVVRRFERAGLVLFGQTNTPELGLVATTEPVMRGPTRNPWNLARSSGGSSGGSAAAVAARIVPAAHGNDGGGSLRIPASACGVFALKPTRGRVTLAPELGEEWSGLVSTGVLTRSVRDSAALLDAIAGPAPGDPHFAPPPSRPYLEETRTPPGRLRVAFSAEPLYGRTTHPECRAAVEDAARLLESLGHEVVEARPEFPRDALVHAYLVAVAASTAADVELAARATGRLPGPHNLELETWALASGGRILDAVDVALARQDVERAARGIGAFFERHDVFVTPTTAHPALPIGANALRPLERIAIRAISRLGSRALLERLLGEISSRIFEVTANTMLFNQTGQPAMSVPLHWTREGLPVGVQIAGRFGDETTLFRLAAQLEAARPWADKAPPAEPGPTSMA